jgi:hypothetical protein
MKIPILILLLACSTFFAAQAQIPFSCLPDSAVVGQALTVSIIGQGTNFTGATSTYLRSGQNYIYPSNFSVVSSNLLLANYVIPPNSLLGQWDAHIWANSIDYALPAGFLIQAGIPNGNYGRVTGKIYTDNNLDCNWNVGEAPVPWRAVTITPGPFQAMADINGDYSVWLPLGSYDLDFHPAFPITNTCVLSGQRSVSLTTNGQVLQNESFGTSTIAYFDAYTILGGLRLRPGFHAARYVHVYNNGNTPIPNALVKLVKPSFASFGSSFSHAPAYISGDTVAWNLTNISNSVVLTYQVYCPPGIAIGTPYTVSSFVVTSPIDYFLSNNTSTCEELVVGAWDPNDKRVFTPSGADADGDITASDTMLTYIVRFQNTGTDTAYNVYVRDTLDLPNLDMNGFRIVGATHPYQVTMSSGGQLEFAFPNIMLPDSGANQMGSNGSLTYQVAPKAGLPLGTVISNSASIYFDFNAPVKTNTTHSRICDLLNADYVATPNGLTVQFADQSVGTVQNYAWDFGDGNTSTLQNPTHTYASGGTYSVCLIANGICRSDTTCQSSTLVAMSDALPRFSISVIPNPMGHMAMILVENAGIEGEFEMDLYDARGLHVKQLHGTINSRTTFIRENLTSGFYFYRIHQEGVTLGSGRMIISGE